MITLTNCVLCKEEFALSGKKSFSSRGLCKQCYGKEYSNGRIENYSKTNKEKIEYEPIPKIKIVCKTRNCKKETLLYPSVVKYHKLDKNGWRCGACKHFYKTYKFDCPDAKGLTSVLQKLPMKEQVEFWLNPDNKSIYKRKWKPFVEKNKDGCLVWVRHNKKGGSNGWKQSPKVTGYADFGGRKVHRLAYEHLIAPIPEGMTIHHKCANTLCVNPDHLQLSTNAENILEMNARNSYIRHIACLEKRIKELEKKIKEI